MRNKSLAAILTAIALLAAACGGDPDSSATTDPPTPDPINLAGTRWVATGMFLGGAPVAFVPDARPTIDFSNNGREFGGSTGCNSYFGEYTVGGGTIGFGGIGQTEMACQQPLMEQEANVIAILQQASVYSVADGILTIGQLGGSALQFEDRSVAIPDAALAGTLWNADTIVTGQAATTLVPGSQITFRIDPNDSTARGTTGCNDYGASVEWDDSQIVFGQVEATEKGCDPALMEQENFVLTLLNGELSVDIDGDRLTLTAPDGRGISFTAGS